MAVDVTTPDYLFEVLAFLHVVLERNIIGVTDRRGVVSCPKSNGVFRQGTHGVVFYPWRLTIL